MQRRVFFHFHSLSPSNLSKKIFSWNNWTYKIGIFSFLMMMIIQFSIFRPGWCMSITFIIYIAHLCARYYFFFQYLWLNLGLREKRIIFFFFLMKNIWLVSTCPCFNLIHVKLFIIIQALYFYEYPIFKVRELEEKKKIFIFDKAVTPCVRTIPW